MLPPWDKTYVAPPMSSWKLCTVTQVEELKILLRMFPVWASFVIDLENNLLDFVEIFQIELVWFLNQILFLKTKKGKENLILT